MELIVLVQGEAGLLLSGLELLEPREARWAVSAVAGLGQSFGILEVLDVDCPRLGRLMKQRVRLRVAAVGLHGWQGRRVHGFSLGITQRVTLIHKRHLLLFHEIAGFALSLLNCIYQNGSGVVIGRLLRRYVLRLLV